MILVALLIGAVLIVAAIRNSQGALASALVADVPAFVVWGAALFAIGAIGFIPGLKPVSRGLLALVITVLVLKNWTAIQAGFADAATHLSTPAATDQAAGIKAAGAAGAAAGSSAGSSLGSMLSDYVSQALNAGQVAGASAADPAAGSSFTDLSALLETA